MKIEKSFILSFIIFLFSLSGTSKAQAQKPDSSCSKFIFSSVLEVKHTSMIDLENRDKKTVEINIINRYISAPTKIGGSVMIKNNDTISMSLAGITFYPYNWCRVDLMTGIYIIKSEEENKKTPAGGIRIWLGNQLIDSWANIYGGEFFLIEAILLVSPAKWLKLGIMADNTGWGPRVEILPTPKTTPNLKIYGGVVGNWQNKNKTQNPPLPGYQPQQIYGVVGLKLIF